MLRIVVLLKFPSLRDAFFRLWQQGCPSVEICPWYRLDQQQPKTAPYHDIIAHVLDSFLGELNVEFFLFGTLHVSFGIVFEQIYFHNHKILRHLLSLSGPDQSLCFFANGRSIFYFSSLVALF